MKKSFLDKSTGKTSANKASDTGGLGESLGGGPPPPPPPHTHTHTHTHTLLCVTKTKKRNRRKKQRVLKQKLLKDCCFSHSRAPRYKKFFLSANHGGRRYF